MKLRLALIPIMLLLTPLACSAPLLGEGGETPPPELPSNVLFQDDFSDPSSGWDRISVEDGITDYSDGVYRIFVNTVNSDVWANPGLDFGDVRVEVDAAKAGGDDNNDFGVICRYQGPENFYFFIISSDGYYGIGKISSGVQQLIGMESMPPSEAILQGEATNRLRADCIGSKLSLYVNGEFLWQSEDSDFASGDVGLLAGSIDAAGTDIHFDNFVVLTP